MTLFFITPAPPLAPPFAIPLAPPLTLPLASDRAMAFFKRRALPPFPFDRATMRLALVLVMITVAPLLVAPLPDAPLTVVLQVPGTASVSELPHDLQNVDDIGGGFRLAFVFGLFGR